MSRFVINARAVAFLRRVQGAVLSCILFLAFTAHGQGTFQNLNFESATLVPIPGDPFDSVEFAPAFPGWIGYVNNVQQTAALYNNIFLSSAGVTIIGAGSPSSGFLIQGNYSAVLESGVGLFTGIPSDVSLAQTGQIPASTQSLLFAGQLSSGTFAVTLGGQSLSLVPVGTGPNYILYGADIHDWSGQTAELKFTVFATPASPSLPNFFSLDEIQFSTQTIPEPGIWSLLVCGLVVIGWRQRRRLLPGLRPPLPGSPQLFAKISERPSTACR